MGTLTYEDIYGVGSMDTLPASEVGQTKTKTNPNDPEQTGAALPGQTSLMHVFRSGNILGQPIVIWFGLVVLLVAVKYFVEK
jgi:hypothetical protein